MAQQYWVRSGNGIHGPFDQAQVRGLVQLGQLTPAMEISVNQTTWYTAGKVKGLFPAPDPSLDTINSAFNQSPASPAQLATAQPTSAPALPISPPPSAQSERDQGISPALWNPAAAVNWSVLFSPILGSYLHAKNWKSLQQPQNARTSWIWFAVSVVVMGVAAFAPISTKAAGGMTLWLLILWYFFSARKQIAHVRNRFSTTYPRKSFGVPVAISVGTLLGVLAIGAAVNLFDDRTQVNNATMQESTAPSAHISKMNAPPSPVPAFAKADQDQGPDVKAFLLAVYAKYIADVGAERANPQTGGAVARCASDRVGVNVIRQMHYAQYEAVKELPVDTKAQAVDSWLRSLGPDGGRTYNTFLSSVDDAYRSCMSTNAAQTTAKNTPATSDASDASTASTNATLDCNDPHVQSMVIDSAMSEGVDPTARDSYIAAAKAAMDYVFTDVRTEGNDASGRLICTATIKLKAKPDIRRVDPEKAKLIDAMSVRGKYAVYRIDNGEIRAESIH